MKPPQLSGRIAAGKAKREASRMKDTTEIIEGLQKHVAKQVNEPKSLSEMEGQIRKLMRVIGRLLLQVWLIWEENKNSERRAEV
jgi:hypothetical protein